MKRSLGRRLSGFHWCFAVERYNFWPMSRYSKEVEQQHEDPRRWFFCVSTEKFQSWFVVLFSKPGQKSLVSFWVSEGTFFPNKTKGVSETRSFSSGFSIETIKPTVEIGQGWGDSARVCEIADCLTHDMFVFGKQLLTLTQKGHLKSLCRSLKCNSTRARQSWINWTT